MLYHVVETFIQFDNFSLFLSLSRLYVVCGSCHKTYHARCESPGEAVTILEAASQTCNRCAEADDVEMENV